MAGDPGPEGTYAAETVARRAGVSLDDVRRLTELGILLGNPDHGYADAEVRRIHVVRRHSAHML